MTSISILNLRGKIMDTKTSYTAYACDLCRTMSGVRIPSDVHAIPVGWTKLRGVSRDRHVCAECRAKILDTQPQEKNSVCMDH